MLDAALSVSIDAIVPGAFASDVESAVQTVIERDDPEANIQLWIRHGTHLDAATLSVSDTARPLRDGEFFQLRLEGQRQGRSFVGVRTGVIGTCSDDRREFLSHLVEAMDWFISTLTIRPRRPYVLTETRGRLLEVSGGRLQTGGESDLLIAPGKPVALPGGEPLWIETSLSCDRFGRATLVDMVHLTDAGARRITTYPWNVETAGKELG